MARHRRQCLHARRRAPADLRRAGRGAQAGRDLGHHEIPRHHPDARSRQRRDGRAFRQGGDRRAARTTCSRSTARVPIGITVEGANIVTRNLIIFGQGAIRAHPHMLDEMHGAAGAGPGRSRSTTSTSISGRMSAIRRRPFSAPGGRAWTGGALRPAPGRRPSRRIYRRLSRWSAAFAADRRFRFLTLGGALKRKEMISARHGRRAVRDVPAVGRAETLGGRGPPRGRPAAGATIAADTGFTRIGKALDEVIANLPARWAAWLLRPTLCPAACARPADDHGRGWRWRLQPVGRATRLTGRCTRRGPGSGLAQLDHAYRL